MHADHGTLTETDPILLSPIAVSARYLSYAVLDSLTGALLSQTVQFTTFRDFSAAMSLFTGKSKDYGSASAPAGHPDVRSDDYVAFHMGGDIQTVSFPADDLAVAPEPITSASPERDPAWSPDGISLGFIRTSGGARRLGVFNATPGIQTIVNPLVSLGAEAPSPQTRAYQEVWGGLSLADAPPSTTPQIGCDATCRARLQGASTGGTVILSPSLSLRSAIGIFVVRVVGKRKLLGRSAPPRPRRRQGAARTREEGTQPQALERQGQRQAPPTGDLPADLPLAEGQADHEHVGLDPLQGRQGRQDPSGPPRTRALAELLALGVRQRARAARLAVPGDEHGAALGGDLAVVAHDLVARGVTLERPTASTRCTIVTGP